MEFSSVFDFVTVAYKLSKKVMQKVLVIRISYNKYIKYIFKSMFYTLVCTFYKAGPS